MSETNLTEVVRTEVATPASPTTCTESTGSNHKRYEIPATVSNDPLSAATYYWSELGWAVHPLYGHNARNCTAKQVGKAPILEGWSSHTASQITEELIQEWFDGTEPHNVGVVVRPPHVVVDLDSKNDQGESVRRWVASVPELAQVPREETAGGAHLHFICRDLPPVTKANGKRHKSALQAKVSEHVSGELFFNGQNIVVAPSIHRNGRAYSWQVTGEIPEIMWVELQRLFRFKLPNQTSKSITVSAKSSWWHRFKGDFRTLNLVKAFQETGRYGALLDADEGKHSVKCPWCDQHSDGCDAWDENDSSCVIFERQDDKWPGWRCLHQSHGEKSLEDLLIWFEEQQPGLVDQCCAEQRVWSEGQQDTKGRKRVVLPGAGRELSEFASEVGDIVGPGRIWFCKGQEVVQIREEKISHSARTLVFHVLDANETRTVIEDHVQTGFLKPDDNGDQVFVPQSMSRETAAALLAAPQLRRSLCQIERILDVPVPVLLDGDLSLVQRGYDERLKTYCPTDAPEIAPLPLPESKAVLAEIVEDFCFADDQSVTNFLARLLTPFIRGLMGWSARPPVWLFEGNRPRAGKDYLAMIVPLVYEGRPNEDAPLDAKAEETGKRIVAALRAGRRFMHFANCRGHIDNYYFEQAATAKVVSARSLGKNDASSDLTLPNEVELSLSTNTGTTFTEDFGLRCRRISLHYSEEDANARSFKRLDLHGYVLVNRSKVLSALAGLVWHWHREGKPKGPTSFTSFPEWAQTVGGILTCCGLGDPCVNSGSPSMAGDSVTEDMKKLFAVGFEKHPDKWIGKPEVYALISDNEEEELFHWWDLGTRGDQTAFSLKFRGFVGRVLGGIQLQGRDLEKRRPKFVFTELEDAPRQNYVGGILSQEFDCQPSQGCHPSYPLSTLEDKNNKNNNIHTNTIIRKGCQNVAIVDVVATFGGLERHQTGVARVLPPVETYPKVDNVDEVDSHQRELVLPAFRLIETKDDLQKVTTLLASTDSTIALDLETYGNEEGDGLNPRRGDIRLLTLALPEQTPLICDLMKVGYELGELGRLLEQRTLLIHNAKFDLGWLRAKCQLNPRNVICTQTLSRLLNAGTNEKNGLVDCLKRHLDVIVDKEEQTSDWSSPILTPSQYDYAARDVSYLHQLVKVMQAAIATTNLVAVAELENALLPVVVDMETNGFVVDTEKLHAIAEAASNEAQNLVPAIQEALKTEVNPGSPKQLLNAFAIGGVELPNTNEETLVSCNHPAAKLILEWRSKEKTCASAQGYLEAVEADGRIHASFNPTGSAAGRFSCKEPNLQNVGRSSELRSCFKAAEGHQLVIADFSQIELRAAAIIAPDQRLLNSYLEGIDVHTQTAALVLKKEVTAVTKEDRQLAKAVNFGLLYGQSAGGLCRYAKTTYGVAMTESEAATFRTRFFNAYRGLAKWHQKMRSAADAGLSETRTLLGRRRLLPEDNWWQRFSSGLNTPVQGTCADGLKLALVKLGKELPKEVKLISTVHDEIILESPTDMTEQAAAILKRCMVEGISEVLQGVPIEVGVSVGNDWASK